MAKVASTLPEVLPPLTGYDANVQFYAERYKQGGRTVYSMGLSLTQVESIVRRPDPSKPTPGNRAIRLNHAVEFGKYLRKRSDWVAPSIILRAPNIFKFQVHSEIEGTEFGILSFPRFSTDKIDILDGQHRILGIHLAKDGISKEMDQASSRLAAARKFDKDGPEVAEARKRIEELKKEDERLHKERLNIQIHIVEDPTAYKQMFFDIADNALGITSSVKARFDNRKVVNRALDAVTDHPLLMERVDPERDRIGPNSPYLLGAKHVAEIVRTVTVGLEGRISRLQEAVLDDNVVADKTKDFFTMMVRAFPDLQDVQSGKVTPAQLRSRSLLGSVLILRILAGVYYDLIVDRERDEADVEAFFAKLAPHMSAPVYPESIWLERTGVFDDRAMAPHSRRQDIAELKDTILDWAIAPPAWLNEDPKPRPEIEERPVVEEGVPPLEVRLLGRH